MATNYVLIDFENVQPSNLEVLKQHPFNVVVFVGANQVKIPFDLAAAMQALGDAAQYIKITGTGKNKHSGVKSLIYDLHALDEINGVRFIDFVPQARWSWFKSESMTLTPLIHPVDSKELI